MKDDSEKKSPAEALYKEGMSQNLQSGSASKTLARANFERAASLGHMKALRALSEMTYVGSGGEKNPELALHYKWNAFLRDQQALEALEELASLIGSYAEELKGDRKASERANKAAEHAEQAYEHLEYVSEFLSGLALNRN